MWQARGKDAPSSRGHACRYTLARQYQTEGPQFMEPLLLLLVRLLASKVCFDDIR